MEPLHRLDEDDPATLHQRHQWPDQHQREAARNIRDYLVRYHDEGDTTRHSWRPEVQPPYQQTIVQEPCRAPTLTNRPASPVTSYPIARSRTSIAMPTWAERIPLTESAPVRLGLGSYPGIRDHDSSSASGDALPTLKFSPAMQDSAIDADKPRF